MRDVPSQHMAQLASAMRDVEVHAESNDTAFAYSSAAQMRWLLKRSAFGSNTYVYMKYRDKANNRCRAARDVVPSSVLIRINVRASNDAFNE